MKIFRMEKQKSLKLNFFMNTILTMSSFVFPLITFPYVSRTLLAEGVGKVTFATSIVSYFLIIAQLGIPTYGIRVCAQIRDDKEELSKTVQEIFLINLLMTIISYIIFCALVVAIPKFASDKVLYFVLSLNIIFNTLGMEWLFKALEQYSYIALRSIIFKFIALISMFFWVHKPQDYILYAVITIFASSASSILNVIRVRKYIFIHKFHLNLKRHLKSIVMFFAMSCATTIYTNLDSVMLGFMTTDNDVGYYATAIKIKNILASIVSSLGVVLLPRVSYYIKNKMEKEFKSVTEKAMSFVFIISCPLILYFTLYAKECIRFLAGSNFDNSIVPMQIIMPTLLFIGVTNILGIQILVPLGNEKKVLYSEIVGALIDIILNLILIPIWGIVGAAVGTLFAELSVMVFQVAAVKGVVKDIFKAVSYIKIISSLLVSTVGTMVIKNLLFDNIFIELLFSAIFFFGSYVIMLIMLREKFCMTLMAPYLSKLKEMIGEF